MLFTGLIPHNLSDNENGVQEDGSPIQMHYTDYAGALSRAWVNYTVDRCNMTV